MPWYIHLVAVAFILLCAYLVYGAFFRDSGKKMFDSAGNIFIKSSKIFEVSYKTLVILIFVWAISEYVYLLIKQ
jgi:hypothetical protein